MNYLHVKSAALLGNPYLTVNTSVYGLHDPHKLFVNF